MRAALGIDLGSTSVTVVAVRVDDRSSELVGAHSLPNDAETTLSPDRLIGRSEWDIETMVALVVETARGLCEKFDLNDVVSIGITGQQQGCQLLDANGDSVGPFISWQDQRCKDRIPESERNFLDVMAEMGHATRRGEGLPAFPHAGCPIVTGYTAPTLFWLASMDMMPGGVSAAITAPEFLAHRLIGSKRPFTDATDAAGWGVLDVPNRRWNGDLIDALGIDQTLFPEIVDSCTTIGGLSDEVAEVIGIKGGTPVSVPSGDHQCAFVGAVSDADDTVAVNVGTGGQATVYVDNLSCLSRDESDGSIDHGWLELRPHIEEGYLLAGVGVVGGRTFRTLKDFFVRSAKNVLEIENVDEDRVYERLADLAGDALSDETADVMTASALFTGSREHPDARGEFSGITPGNFTPGSMALAAFRSMASELAASYRSAVKLGAGPRSKVVGSGNGLRLNATLRRCLEESFGGPISIGSVTEEAAVGAALTGAVAVGVYPDINSASRALVR